MAETRADTQRAFDQFINTYQNKNPKATECLEKDHEELLVFYDFPAVHWRRLRGLKQLGKVIEGVKIKDGIEIEQLDNQVAS